MEESFGDRERERDRRVHTHTQGDPGTNRPPGQKSLVWEKETLDFFNIEQRIFLAWAAIIEIADFATEDDDKKQTIT